MATEILLGLAVLVAVVGSALQHRLALARQRRESGVLAADAEGFFFERGGAPPERVRWDNIAEIRFQREEVTDDWSEDEDTWLEESWQIVFRDGTPALEIPHGSPAREQLLVAAPRHLSGFRTDAELLAQPGRVGSQTVYP
ncbi:MAG TPA: hypothetical protein VFS21_01275 [Roseiflexaceae bacterium]|nr:hypothetical protein [Roseiflexaceae bacterium]